MVVEVIAKRAMDDNISSSPASTIGTHGVEARAAER
jgi:hypothetical protein